MPEPSGKKWVFNIHAFLFFGIASVVCLSMGGIVLHERRSHEAMKSYWCKGKGYAKSFTSNDDTFESCIYDETSNACREPHVRVIISTPDNTAVPEHLMWQSPSSGEHSCREKVNCKHTFCTPSDEWFNILSAEDYFPCTITNYDTDRDPTFKHIPPNGSVRGIAPQFCNVTRYIAGMLFLGIFIAIIALLCGYICRYQQSTKHNKKVLLFTYIALVLAIFFIVAGTRIVRYREDLNDMPDMWCAGESQLVADRYYDTSVGWQSDFSSGKTCVLDDPFNASSTLCTRQVVIKTPTLKYSYGFLGAGEGCPEAKRWFNNLKQQPMFPCKMTSEENVIAGPYCNVARFGVLYWSIGTLSMVCFLCVFIQRCFTQTPHCFESWKRFWRWCMEDADVDRNRECKICFKRNKSEILGCGHVICVSCFRILCSEKDPLCPFCRRPFIEVSIV
jgi:hypothetical protein